MKREANIGQKYGLRKMRIRSKCFIEGMRGYHKIKVIFVNCFADNFTLYYKYPLSQEEE